MGREITFTCRSGGLSMIMFFDTETNGLPKNWKAAMQEIDNWPRVIQLAWQVCTNSGEVVSEMKKLISPDGWSIPNEKFWIDNGYSTESNTEYGVPMESILKDFISDYNTCDHLVAHNIAFDHPVLGAEMIRYNHKASVKLNKICTMQESIELCKLPGRYGYKFPKLEELHQYLFGEGFDGAHDAMADVNACRRCFFELIKHGIIKL